MYTKERISSWSQLLPTTTHLADCGDIDFQEIRTSGLPLIPRGSGRSYSDAAYITEGITLTARALGRISEPDVRRQTIHCGAGVQMIDLHRRVEQSGFSFPVFGGTQWATVGGGVASDIHGKNHFSAGSFGHHVESITIQIADGSIVTCSREDHPDLFSATVGGMGQTGHIRGVELRLQRNPRQSLHVKSRPVRETRDIRDCLNDGNCDFQYISWGKFPGQGIHYYATATDAVTRPPGGGSNLWLPRLPLLNRWTLSSADLIRRIVHGTIDKHVHIRKFNYSSPHEFLIRWNRLFGRRGMIEYHFACPEDRFDHLVTELGKCDRKKGTGGLYMAVVKKFGERPSEGLLSFPIPGFTLNFQMINHPENQNFLTRFTDHVLDAGGRIYLAKDSYSTAEQFERMYPNLSRWREFANKWDPENRLQSDLSRRLNMKPW